MNGEADESMYVCSQNIEKPRNRGKAQRVAPPSMRRRDCISYLPTDWLCYCHLASEI